MMKIRRLYNNIKNRASCIVPRPHSGASIQSQYLKERIPWSPGYSEYKYDFIGKVLNSPGIEDFRRGVLPKGYGYRLDERAVEYPWFFSRLKDGEITILDAGSVLNFPQILCSEQLKNKRLYVCTLHYEGTYPTTSSPSYIYEDLRDTCFKDGFFDAICSLSTIEHIGMDNTMLYTDDLDKKENNSRAYVDYLKECSRILKKDGTLYLSMPYGKYTNFGWFQIFNREMVQDVIDTFKPAMHSLTYFRYTNDQWMFSTEVACGDGNYFDINTNHQFEKDYLAASRCVVCLQLTKG